MFDSICRAKKLDSTDWIKGSPIVIGDIALMVTDSSKVYMKTTDSHLSDSLRDVHALTEVDISTIGRYTYKRDKNGVELFEGDIIEHRFYDITVRGIIKWSEGNFSLTSRALSAYSYRNLLYVGNIHDNPELIITEGVVL